MSRLMLFPTAVRREPAIEEWMRQHPGVLGEIAEYWFNVMRHVKLRPEKDVDAAALKELIEAAYHDMKIRADGV